MKIGVFERVIDVDPSTNSSLIAEFPPSFKSLKLLPLLIDLLTNELNVLTDIPDSQTDELISYALSIVLKISETLSNLTFQDKVADVLFKDNSKNKKHQIRLPN